MRARLAVAVLLVASAAAQAQRPATLSELPPLDLGKIPDFTSAAQAQSFCPHDVVVWADRASGYFYPRYHPKYEHTPDGTFTCLREAMRADYWDINPFANRPQQGREFPIDPGLLDFGS